MDLGHFRGGWPPSPPTNWLAEGLSAPAVSRCTPAGGLPAGHAANHPRNRLPLAATGPREAKEKLNVPQPLPVHGATVCRAGLGRSLLARRPPAPGPGPIPRPGRAGHGGLDHRGQRRGQIGPSSNGSCCRANPPCRRPPLPPPLALAGAEVPPNRPPTLWACDFGEQANFAATFQMPAASKMVRTPRQDGIGIGREHRVTELLTRSQFSVF